MRNSYIVCYDIAGPKRLRKVFKTMQAWGVHLQLSVFECRLRRIDLGPTDGRGDRIVTPLGKPYVHIDAPLIVV